MKTFSLNDIIYTAKDLNFNALCYFEKQGVDMTNIDNNTFTFLRAYLAYCMNVEPDVAGEEISAHVGKYGWDSLGDIINVALEDLNNEGFSGNVEKKTPRKTTKKA